MCVTFLGLPTKKKTPAFTSQRFLKKSFRYKPYGRGDSNDSMACIILQKDERRIPTIIILPQSYTILMEKL